MRENIKNSKGFTAIEILIVLAIITILSAFAYMQLRSSNLAAATNMVYYDLHHARSDAISGKHNVRVILGTVAGSCVHNFDGHTYLVHQDLDSDGDCDTGENLSAKDINLDFERVSFVTTQDIITFNPIGTSNAGTITLTEGIDNMAIVVSTTGRIRTP